MSAWQNTKQNVSLRSVILRWSGTVGGIWWRWHRSWNSPNSETSVWWVHGAAGRELRISVIHQTALQVTSIKVNYLLYTISGYLLIIVSSLDCLVTIDDGDTNYGIPDHGCVWYFHTYGYFDQSDLQKWFGPTDLSFIHGHCNPDKMSFSFIVLLKCSRMHRRCKLILSRMLISR